MNSPLTTWLWHCKCIDKSKNLQNAVQILNAVWNASQYRKPNSTCHYILPYTAYKDRIFPFCHEWLHMVAPHSNLTPLTS